METPPPRWLMLLTTFSLFIYQTLDALDGKQARRTGTSSPLGQLFDHGCDCLACIAQVGVTETQYFLMINTLAAAFAGPEATPESLDSLHVVFDDHLHREEFCAWAWIVSEEGGVDLVPVLLQNVLLALWSPEMVAMAAREIGLLTLLHRGGEALGAVDGWDGGPVQHPHGFQDGKLPGNAGADGGFPG
eukprot:Skav225784  [mRNA]  locus=scaffold2147:24333:29292:+ [translate_table: standard]